MKAKFQVRIRATHYSFVGALSAGVFIIIMSSSAPAQNLYVSSIESAPGGGSYIGIITEITEGGTQSPFASGLFFPQGIAFNIAGNVFVGDGSGHIYEFTPAGVRSTFASGLPGGYYYGLAFNSAGNLFATDAGNIYEWTPNGVRSTFASGLAGLYGLAFNSEGDLFAGNQGGNIYEWTPNGVRSTFASGLSFVAGLAFNSAGNLFAAANGGIYEFTPTGVRSTFASGSANSGLAFNSEGDLFATDRNSGNIYEFTPGGLQSTFASGLAVPSFIAFQPVPEPSAVGLLLIIIFILPVYYVRESLHEQPILDFSSYAFNGGDNITRMVGAIVVTRPGLDGAKLSDVRNPSRTVLVAEASALVSWSWHEPSSRLYFTDAKSMVSFVDGRVSYIKIYWDSTTYPGGGVKFALGFDPPAGYNYQWSAN